VKCPHCGKTMASPYGRSVNVNGADIIILTCPICQAILGAVNKPEH